MTPTTTAYELGTEVKTLFPPADHARWPNVSRERGEGLLISLPSLHCNAIYVGFRIARRGPWHLGFGRQFTDHQPRWARFWMWHR